MKFNRRDALTGIAAMAIAAPVAAQQEKQACAGPGPQTLNAAGTLLLLATAEHGAADGLRMALEALAKQAAPC